MLEQITKLSSNVEKLLDTSKDMMEQTEVAFKSVPSTADILTKIEDKLVSYSVVTPALVPEPVDNSEFENKVFVKFDELATGMEELRAQPKPQDGLTSADKEFIHGLANETLSALENVKASAQSSTEKGKSQGDSTIYISSPLIAVSVYILNYISFRSTSGNSVTHQRNRTETTG